MKKSAVLLFVAIFFLAAAASAQQPSATPQQQQSPAPQLVEWSDDFSGDKLDEKKWEKFTFEGGAGGKLEVKDGEVKIRSANGTRAGIRTKESFSGDRFLVEGRVAKVGAAFPDAGGDSSKRGFATLTILFDSAGRNRIEWIFTSDGTLEAWSVVDGRGEQLDNRKLGTKMKNPVLLVGRKGDEFTFFLNDAKGAQQDAQPALKATVKNMPKSFRVMLYGFGSSENNWDAVKIITPKSD
ncbi:MAG: hypothetical protein M3033_06025 [Acidobacteriota bacterium]|nr:hypothetical protein [Acidobacteriota bacterium]